MFYNSTASNQKLKKILEIIKNCFGETIHYNTNSEKTLNLRCSCKILEATFLFVDPSEAFEAIHRRKIKQILLAYGLPKEAVTAIMMLDKNTKVKFYSPDGDTLFFDIVAGVLQGDALVLYMFIICLHCVL